MMKRGSNNKNSGIQRYFFGSHRTSSVQVITFGDLTRTEHRVRLVNISVIGVGIELDQRIEPGLACFEELVGGHRFGVVSWCRQGGQGYRAGIHFVTLSKEQEQYILKQVEQPRSHKALRDPDRNIAALLESLRKETNG
jgi:hypothetical protein